MFRFALLCPCSGLFQAANGQASPPVEGVSVDGVAHGLAHRFVFGVHSSSFVSRTFIAFLIPPCLHSVSSVESVTEHLPCRSGRTIELATVEGPKDRSGTPSLQACTLLLGFRSVSLVWDYDCATHWSVQKVYHCHPVSHHTEHITNGNTSKHETKHLESI